MTRCLLDTNVLSELRRPRPEPKVVSFVASQTLDPMFVSPVTFAEIRFDAGRRTELHDWLTQKLRPMFDARVLDLTEDVMFRWCLLVEEGRKSGHTFSQPDLIIGAIALEHDLTVVTRHTSDYQRARVKVLDPWKDGAVLSSTI